MTDWLLDLVPLWVWTPVGVGLCMAAGYVFVFAMRAVGDELRRWDL